MMPLLHNFLQEDLGQDLIEYTLLLAFLLFCTVAMVGFGGPAIKGIVCTSNSQLAAGNEFATGS
jgi:Flp pilus assembly pilin Flp